MKKTLLLAFVSVIMDMNAQYFEHVYGSANIEEVFAGMNTNQTGQGFVISGVRTSTSNGAKAIALARTDINGDIPASPYFKKNYGIYFNSSLTPVMKPREAYVVELSSTRYAIAGVCYKDETLQKYCVYYAQVDQNGVPMPGPTFNMQYYDLGLDNYYQVRNVRLSPSGNELYIIGLSISNTTGAYYSMVLKVDVATGALLWSYLYNVSGSEENAYDAVEDPATNELVVVGFYNNSVDRDAYILRLDASTGGFVTGTNTMGWGSGTSGTEEVFSCITLATGGGYIIGGWTSMAGNKDSWTVKLDNTFNVVWNTIHDYSGSFRDNYAFAIIERINTFNQPEVFVAGQVLGGFFGNSDLEVHKLDWTTGFSLNQSTYGSSDWEYIVDIDQNNSGTADGLSIFGLTNRPVNQMGNQDLLIFKTYYNGLTSCDYNVNTITSQDGPGNINLEVHKQYESFFASEAWLQYLGNFKESTICFSTTVTGGDNSRQAHDLTAIGSVDPTNSAPRILLDPNNQAITILSENETISSIYVTDINGRQVHVTNNISETQNRLDISNLETGIYLLKVSTAEGKVNNYKFIKNQ